MGAGYVLSIDGCPYLPATQGVTSMPTTADVDPIPNPVTHAAWSSLPTDATLATGFLALPQCEWSEKTLAIEGDLDVSQLSFFLYDALWTGAGPAAGFPFATWMCTRKASAITPVSTLGVGQSISGTSTAGFSVATGTGAQFVGSPVYLWIDQECISAGSITGDGFPAGIVRGRYGSRIVPHTVDDGNSYYPIVYGAFPGVDRRRVILWHVDDANVASPLWRGICTRAPRLGKAGDGDDDGTAIELQCEHEWTIVKQNAAAITTAATYFRGYDIAAIRFLYAYSTGGATIAYDPSTTSSNGLTGIMPTATEAALRVARTICAGITTSAAGVGQTITVSPQAAAAGPGVNVTLTGNFGQGTGNINPAATLTASLKWGYNVGPTSTLSGNPSGTTMVIQSPTIGPYLARILTGQLNTVAVTSVVGLPNPWPSATVTTEPGAPFTTTVQPLLMGQIDQNFWLSFTGVTISAVLPSPVITGTPTISAVGTQPSPPGLPVETPTGHWSRNTTFNAFYFDKLFPLNLSASVHADHWVYGLRRGIIEDVVTVKAGADPRSWNWDQAASIAQHTGGANPSRQWYVDGSRRIGDLVLQECKFNGVGLGIRNSRMAMFLFQPPLPTSPIVATIPASSLAEQTAWTTSESGIANRANVKSNTLQVNVADQGSIGRFGPARVIDITFPGAEGNSSGTDPVALYHMALSRCIALWGYPSRVASFTLPLPQYVLVINAGDYVQVSDWLIPDGLGNRSVQSVIGQVVGRSPSLAKGTMTIEVIFWDFDRLGGYSPSVQAASVSNSGNGIVVAATSYLTGTATDYAGSNLATYNFAATAANDGGVSWFQPGDQIQFVAFDSFAQYTDGPYTIASVTPATKQIKLTAPISGTTLAYGGILDVVFATYGNGSAVTTNEKKFAWSASASAHVIGTSTDAPYRFSP